MTGLGVRREKAALSSGGGGEAAPGRARQVQVEINDEKSRIIDLNHGESFGFLGFDFRRTRSRRGVWCAHYSPKLKKRTALLRKLKAVFRRYQSQPVDRVVQLITPILSGWVNYFAIGHSSECFAFDGALTERLEEA